MPLVRLPAGTSKCATCERWSGARRRSDDGMHVEFDDQQGDGRCTGGPWDGNVRDPLTRCGRWVPWVTSGQ